MPAPLTAVELWALLGEPVEEHRFLADRNYGEKEKPFPTPFTLPQMTIGAEIRWRIGWPFPLAEPVTHESLSGVPVFPCCSAFGEFM
jgi:hypothetical protein